MRPKRYPLDALVRVRREHVDASARELSAAIRAREEAERVRLAAEAERARQAHDADRVRAAEASALDRGQLSAADLQRQGAWEARTQWEDGQRARQVDAARERESSARGGEGRAMAEVAKAEAGAKVVTEHRARWAAQGERAAEAAAEEEATDAWRPPR
jgi:hypothetical protein